MIVDPNVDIEKEKGTANVINLIWTKLKNTKHTALRVKDKMAAMESSVNISHLEGPAALFDTYMELAQKVVSAHDEYGKFLAEFREFEQAYLNWIKVTKGEEVAIDLLTKLRQLKGK